MRFLARFSHMGRPYYLTTALEARGSNLDLVSPWDAAHLVQVCGRADPIGLRRTLSEVSWGQPPRSSDEHVRGEVRRLVEDRRLVFLRGQVTRSRSLGGPGSEIDPGAPFAPEAEPEHWIQVEVVDDDDQPLANVAVLLRLPNNRVLRTRTNQAGAVYVPSLPAGQCVLTLPELDAAAWSRA